MREITYYEAFDGELFESDDECNAYEWNCTFESVKSDIRVYDQNRRLIPLSYSMNIADIWYVYIGSEAAACIFNDWWLDQLNRDFFEDGEDEVGLFFYDEAIDHFYNWEAELYKLTEMAQHFQYFSQNRD